MNQFDEEEIIYYQNSRAQKQFETSDEVLLHNFRPLMSPLS